MSISFGDLKKDVLVAGFRAKAVYKNGAEQAMGGRFVHEKSGFTLDLIEIQSVPQSFLSVHSFPTSNMGEPHTQEHLLLGKGNVGRAVAATETMSMVESTAFTQQLKTCYPFAANAGVESYFEHFDRSTNALLHPDYTDEEIRREVRNFGVKVAADGKLELEEKGTIYAEMQSAVSQPGYRVYRAMGRLQYGLEHPMSFDSGGDPVYIREMKPEHIRRFHAANYHLANIEMVASLPNGLELGEALGRFDTILTRLQSDKPVRPAAKLSDLPAPRPPQPEGTIQMVGFPSRDLQQAAPAQFAWHPMPRMNQQDESLAGLFAQAVGGDPSTNLYKIFIDSKTRKMDIGARSVSLGFDNESYAEFTVYIPDLAAARANSTDLAAIRELVKAEFERISGWADDSSELLEFHSRMQASLVRLRRATDKLTSSPPGFGSRMGQSSWPGLFRELAEEPSFEKSLVQPDLFTFLEGIVSSGTNIWREKLREWKLIDVVPYAVAGRAESGLIDAEEASLQGRLAAELLRLKVQYQVSDEQEAIRLYQREYDAASAELERVQSQDAPARFIDAPPMSLDEQLDYTVKNVASGITLVTGRFAGMTSATAGLALSMKELSGRQLVYASLFPQLLTGVGATKDGKTLDFEEAMQRMRREILGVGASCTANPATGRIELVLTASGNTLDESKAALDWMRAMLFLPNWTIDNLGRIKDVVDQSINALRTTTQRSEETWVSGPAEAWTYQDDPLLLSVSSFHTRLYHLHRLRWMLLDASDDDQSSVAHFLTKAEALPFPILKASLEALIEPSSPAARQVAEEATKDLLYFANELPVDSAPEDWKELVRTTRQDFLAPATQALSQLEQVRATLAKQGNARLFLTASPDNAAVLEPLLTLIATELSAESVGALGPTVPRLVAQRVMARGKLAEEPTFMALVAPNMQGGVHLHSAKFVSIKDLDEESALQFLAAKLYGGGGPHGVFMKTWGAGLAYSNGLRSSAIEGRIAYYAERTPELPQTLKFVIAELRNAPRDIALSEYALAQVFVGTRAGGSFEGRTSAMAGDLADGIAPEVIEAFRRSILALRNKPDLEHALYSRMDAAASRVLPGYTDTSIPTPGATYFVIGPDKQLAAWEAYLGAPLHRLFPRDYWVIVE